jgi:arylsulfatase A-like enzyme
MIAERVVADRPNILWYCTDAQRYDTVAALGNSHIRTPNIDRLCADGVAFTRTYAQSPLCTPSRASFMTGRYCASHHVYRNGAARFPSDEVLVTRLLADAGYDCGLVGKLHIASAECGEARYDDGYRVFHSSNLPYPGEAADHLNEYLIWLRDQKSIEPEDILPRYTIRDPGRSHVGQGDVIRPGPDEALRQTKWANELALRFVEEDRDGPWLLSINPYDPHPPFLPPSMFLANYDPATMPPPLFRPEDLDHQKRFANIRAQNTIARDPLATHLPDPDASSSPDARARTSFNGRLLKCGYYAMIEMIDRHFGELLDALDERGQLDNTIVIFHSDHGELLGDHGLVYKGARFFDGVVRVPLIVRWPERCAGGQRVDGLTELIDIAPTLLDAVGLEVPDAMQGRSLLPVLAGQAEDTGKDVVVSEFYDSCNFSEGTDDPTQAMMSFDGRYKMVTYRGHSLGELYDLENDPGEFEDLWEVADCSDLKLAVLERHVDAIMGAISSGPRRSTRY